MIAALEKVKTKFEELPDVMMAIVREGFREDGEVLEEFVSDQLWAGLDGNNEFLPDYSPTSVEVFGKPAGPIRLFDEGDYYRGLTLVDHDEFAEVEGKDPKSDDLSFEYGSAITKVSPEHEEEFKDDYLTAFITKRLKFYFDE